MADFFIFGETNEKASDSWSHIYNSRDFLHFPFYSSLGARKYRSNARGLFHLSRIPLFNCSYAMFRLL